ncbi:uncharacterized protein EURHEDRAFT_337502 [Aspergillus ruber CBS 135680]|uniref:Uncharacterized protein n=1 Tax=Aspergillus ruber (strain CBS 135680) TaxID=1388766 RepID=A0A017SKA8_ASPRC|nr:uncharacterized protein EURHEDRAFT_337502 [Aspergillus ruber CBS 135680]EYE96760.1 hypothetical protein EURHEDRAFT_337502 [Aspergillus ruber CBS 135680]
MAIQADAKSPSYVSVDSSLYASEKRELNAPCSVHSTSQTPRLDHQLQQPETKAALQALATALNNIADEKQCTKCAVEASSNFLTDHLRDIRAAKKNGQWSKEDKKALKAEIKGFKSLKTNFKALWKDN